MVKDAVVSITTPLAWSSSGAFLYFTDSTVVEFAVETDEMKVTADALALEVVSKVEASGNITLPVLGAKGSTISWASDNETVISAAGVVVAPAEGTVTVKLTATIKLNEATQTKEFNVVVGVSSVVASFNFGTTNQTGYSAATKTMVDAISGNTFDLVTVGAQITSSTYTPHDTMGSFLAISGSKGVEGVSSASVNLGTLTATSVSFSFSIWSPADLGRVTSSVSIELQAKVGDAWVTISSFADQVSATEYKTLTVDTAAASEFRFYTVGVSGDTRFTIDNIVFNA
jgi:hypothetical protein